MIATLIGYLFSAKPPRWVVWGWLAGLYLVGLFLWGQFFNWGRIPFDFHDWAEICAPRIAFVQNAVRTGQLPLHMPDASALRGVTDRFLSLPDVILAPQMLLLAVLDVGQYVLVNTWLMFTIGVAGLYWFWRRWRLSPAAFAVLFLLFNFNGHLLAHFSVGHVNYSGYFLFPWLLALMVQLLDLRREARLPGWRWVAGTAFLLFFMLLNGSFHQFLWSLMFLGLVGLFDWKVFPRVLGALLLSGLLSAVRLLPPVLEMANFDREFLSGYTALLEVWNALVQMRPPAPAVPSMLTSLGWWEFDLFVGLAGAGFLLYFGLYRWMKERAFAPQLQALFAPAAVLFVLSIGRLYRPLMLVPVLSSERVSARMIVLPFVVLLLLAVLMFQHWLETHAHSTLLRLGMLLAGVVLLNDLWQNLKLWRVNVAAQAFPVTPVNLALKVVANHADAAYTNLLAVGAGITLVTAVLLVGMAWREKRAQNLPKAG